MAVKKGLSWAAVATGCRSKMNEVGILQSAVTTAEQQARVRVATRIHNRIAAISIM